MIDKYSTEAMKHIWSEQHRYEVWWDIERAVLQGWKSEDELSQKTLDRIDANVDWSVDAIKRREQTVKHDMLAFLEVLEDSLGDLSGDVHRGLTSSDVKDTESAVRLMESLDLLVDCVDQLLDRLETMAHQHRDTVMIGRTHGVHAEPVTFGLKCTVWYQEFIRQRRRLTDALDQISVGKMSGAVGTFSKIPPSVERVACDQLGIDHALASSQILQRDRHAEVFNTLSNVAGTVEKIAVEIRNLQRTEILEVQEGFSEGQKGSSAMPHKKNPIVSERLSGQARLMRGYASDIQETQALWHERDLSNSSTERVAFQDGMNLIHYMLQSLDEVLDGLGVRTDNMTSNLEQTNGLIYSQNVMLSLTESGWSRNRAYERVQGHAMESWEQGSSFETLIRNDSEITDQLADEQLRECFKPQTFLQNIDTIYQRVFDN